MKEQSSMFFKQTCIYIYIYIDRESGEMNTLKEADRYRLIDSWIVRDILKYV